MSSSSCIITIVISKLSAFVRIAKVTIVRIRCVLFSGSPDKNTTSTRAPPITTTILAAEPVFIQPTQFWLFYFAIAITVCAALDTLIKLVQRDIAKIGFPFMTNVQLRLEENAEMLFLRQRDIHFLRLFG